MSDYNPIILIVDDIVANRVTLIALLEGQGYQLVEAEDGPTALRLVAETPPDLVLLDVMMPGMDGFEVCRKIRAELCTKEVPIVMVTALDDQAARLSGFEAGADGYVTKPFNLAELRSRVGAITRLNRYRRLADQQHQFQWIVEQATEGYLIVNAVDEILFANPSARRWLGLPPDRGDGTSEGTFLAAMYRGLTVASHSPELWREWPNVPAATLALPRFLVRPETREAKAVFLEVSIFENTEGRLLRLRDVSERMGVQRGQRSFQMMMSHKLLTPLNGVLGPLEILAQCEDMEAKEQTELTTMVHDSARRLVGAVEDVVRFTESSIRPAQGEEFALTGLSDLVVRVAASLELPPVTVSVADETHAALLGCAPEVLEWVLFELFENAKKFHPHGMPKVHVTTSLTGTNRVSLTVGDDGRTLSPEQLTLAGTPYFQGEHSFTGEVAGMGLGLASVFTLVWQVGGSCYMANQPVGPGVCVELQWPRAAAPVEPDMGDAGSGPRTTAPPRTL